MIDDNRLTPLLGRILAQDGFWLVPRAERPTGWQSMGLREQPCEHKPKPRAPRISDQLSDRQHRFIAGMR